MKGFLLVAGVVILMLTGCGASHKSALDLLSIKHQQQHRAVASLHCSSHAPQLQSLRSPRHYGRLVSPAAIAVRLCRYYGLNGSNRLGLARSRLITKIALVDFLARALNSLPTKRSTYFCPFDDGSEILLLFAYANRGSEHVTVGLRGCNAVTNGHTGTLAISPAGRQLLTQLTALTR